MTKITRFLCFGLNWWNGLYFAERVTANYYVTDYQINKAGKDEAKKLTNNPGKSKLVDATDEHPLPSIPGLSRNVKFDNVSSVWDKLKLRAGS
jgi:hypothetical protein